MVNIEIDDLQRGMFWAVLRVRAWQGVGLYAGICFNMRGQHRGDSHGGI